MARPIKRKARFDPSAPSPDQEGGKAILFFIGLALCFTGIGAIIGIPIIIASMKRPLKGAWRADCPYCETELLFGARDTTAGIKLACPSCRLQSTFDSKNLVAPSIEEA